MRNLKSIMQDHNQNYCDDQGRATFLSQPYPLSRLLNLGYNSSQIIDIEGIDNERKEEIRSLANEAGFDWLDLDLDRDNVSWRYVEYLGELSTSERFLFYRELMAFKGQEV